MTGIGLFFALLVRFEIANHRWAKERLKTEGFNKIQKTWSVIFIGHMQCSEVEMTNKKSRWRFSAGQPKKNVRRFCQSTGQCLIPCRSMTCFRPQKESRTGRRGRLSGGPCRFGDPGHSVVFCTFGCGNPGHAACLLQNA